MKLTVKSGKNGKVHIYLDDEYRATVDGDWWYSEKYRNCKEIDEEELTELLRSVSFRRAYSKGLDLLDRRLHGSVELARKLRERGFERDAADYAINKLSEYGLLDDAKFARLYAEELQNRKHYGKKRIMMELSKRGIDRQTAQNAVDLLDNDPVESIIIIIRKKYMKKLDTEKGRQSLIAALNRMGYGYDDIKKALNRVSDDEGETDEL